MADTNGKRLLIFGRTGQVATELASIDPGALLAGRDTADLTRPGECSTLIAETNPAAVINAAAWTSVDDAEENRETAFKINGEAPGAMAQVCAALNIPFVHISTDYVFDGRNEHPWQPGDPARPLNVYGESKLAGEDAVRAASGIYAILRTSWVFSPHGPNFVRTMLRLAKTQNNLRVVDDQLGGPTPAIAIARACVTIAQALRTDPSKSGIYHLSGTPDISWANFARAIFEAASEDITVESIASSEHSTLAPRPLNSRLACNKLKMTFGIARPDWAGEVERVLRQYKSSDA